MRALLIGLLLITSSAFAKFVQLGHGQTAFYGKHQILCTSPAKEANSCFIQKLKSGKYGIVLSDQSVKVQPKGWALLSAMERLYNNGECSDYYRFTVAQKNVMPAGSRLKFKNQVYRCPSNYEVSRKNCRLLVKGSHYTIITPGGVVIPGGAFATTKIKINRLMKMNICNDVSEI